MEVHKVRAEFLLHLLGIPSQGVAVPYFWALVRQVPVAADLYMLRLDLETLLEHSSWLQVIHSADPEELCFLAQDHQLLESAALSILEQAVELLVEDLLLSARDLLIQARVGTFSWQSEKLLPIQTRVEHFYYQQEKPIKIVAAP